MAKITKLGTALHFEKDISKCNLKLFSLNNTLVVVYSVV